mgnify:CR=1 FL=1
MASEDSNNTSSSDTTLEAPKMPEMPEMAASTGSHKATIRIGALNGSPAKRRADPRLVGRIGGGLGRRDARGAGVVRRRPAGGAAGDARDARGRPGCAADVRGGTDEEEAAAVTSIARAGEGESISTYRLLRAGWAGRSLCKYADSSPCLGHREHDLTAYLDTEVRIFPHTAHAAALHTCPPRWTLLSGCYKRSA